MGSTWGLWLTYLLAAFFIGNGVVNFVNPAPFRADYARWRLPSWFFLFNGGFQLLAGLLLIFEPTRVVGFVMAVAVCLGVYGLLTRHREFAHMGPITVVSFLVALAIWRLYA